MAGSVGAQPTQTPPTGGAVGAGDSGVQTTGPLLAMQVTPVDLGLGGWVRPGGWTPLRVGLTWSGAEPVEVALRWALTDGSGDPMRVVRRAALTPGRERVVWLYAPTPTWSGLDRAAEVRAVDPATDLVLAEAVVAATPERRLSPRDAAIGVMGSRSLGLEALERHETQHERVVQVQGLTLENLPDRWYGLGLVETLVWTAEGGGDPLSARFTPARQASLRQWVQRGGDLVIFWPEAGDGWLRSGLADLLPVGVDGVERMQGRIPAWAGGPVQTSARVRLSVFTPDPSVGGQSMLFGQADGATRVLAASRRVGFGRVTVIGLDVTSAEVMRALPREGMAPLWKRLVGWTGPVYAQAFVDAQPRSEFTRANQMARVDLGTWMEGRIAMRGRVGLAVALGVLLFAVYWVLAGPVAYAVLKAKGKLAWAWPVFGAAAVVFSGLAWGGAYLLRPAEEQVAHVSVVDLDSTGGMARIHSRMAVFLPRFGPVELGLARDDSASEDAGLDGGLNGEPSGGLSGGWLGVFGGLEAPAAGLLRRAAYSLDAADPSAASFDFRATTQQLVAQWQGPTPDGFGVTSDLRVAEDGSLSGVWAHNYGGTLRNAIAVYSPSARASPVVYDLGDVQPGRAVTFDGPANAPLSTPSVPSKAPRAWGQEGWLGVRAGRWIVGGDGLLGAPADGALNRDRATGDLARISEAVWMASFFDRLPYPRFFGSDGRESKTLQQPLLRGMDLSHLLDGRRVIVLGLVEGAALPAPLRVDGRAVARTDPGSLTVVRWIGEPAPLAATP
ncbi:MAG: hypothetical protein AAF288_12335 [Planctomycetota bacterium]